MSFCGFMKQYKFLLFEPVYICILQHFSSSLCSRVPILTRRSKNQNKFNFLKFRVRIFEQFLPPLSQSAKRARFLIGFCWNVDVHVEVRLVYIILLRKLLIPSTASAISLLSLSNIFTNKSCELPMLPVHFFYVRPLPTKFPHVFTCLGEHM